MLAGLAVPLDAVWYVAQRQFDGYASLVCRQFKGVVARFRTVALNQSHHAPVCPQRAGPPVGWCSIGSKLHLDRYGSSSRNAVDVVDVLVIE